MRTFEIGGKFGLIIIPGHSFQFMPTSDEQVQCFENIKRHLLDNRLLVVHLDYQDVRWLGELLTKTEPVFKTQQELIVVVRYAQFTCFQAWYELRTSGPAST
jgi:hypothetical protein